MPLAPMVMTQNLAFIRHSTYNSSLSTVLSRKIFKEFSIRFHSSPISLHSNSCIKSSRRLHSLLLPAKTNLVTIRQSSSSANNIDSRIAGRRRFYKNVGVTRTPPPSNDKTPAPSPPISPSWYGVTLDNKPLRTPVLKRQLSLPNHHLALAI